MCHATGAAIGNTSCILFNSRGIPVDPAGAPPAVGAPTGNDAMYLTDGTAVYGETISATGLIKLWRTNPAPCRIGCCNDAHPSHIQTTEIRRRHDAD